MKICMNVPSCRQGHNEYILFTKNIVMNSEPNDIFLEYFLNLDFR